MSFNLDPESLRRRNDAHEAMRGQSPAVSPMDIALLLSPAAVLALWLFGVISGHTALWIGGGLEAVIAVILVLAHLMGLAVRSKRLEAQCQQLADRVQSLERRTGGMD